MVGFVQIVSPRGPLFTETGDTDLRRTRIFCDVLGQSSEEEMQLGNRCWPECGFRLVKL